MSLLGFTRILKTIPNDEQGQYIRKPPNSERKTVADLIF